MKRKLVVQTVVGAGLRRICALYDPSGPPEHETVADTTV